MKEICLQLYSLYLQNTWLMLKNTVNTINLSTFKTRSPVPTHLDNAESATGISHVNFHDFFINSSTSSFFSVTPKWSWEELNEVNKAHKIRKK